MLSAQLQVCKHHPRHRMSCPTLSHSLQRSKMDELSIAKIEVVSGFVDQGQETCNDKNTTVSSRPPIR